MRRLLADTNPTGVERDARTLRVRTSPGLRRLRVRGARAFALVRSFRDGGLGSFCLGAVLVACGPPHVFHKDPERGCAEITLASQEDVAAAAGCSAFDSITLRTGMPLDLKPLGRLTTIRGALLVGPTVGVAELALPRLREVGAVKLVANGNLTGVFLPALERAAAFEVEGNQALTTISAPKLARVDGNFTISGNAALEMLDVAALASAGNVEVSGNRRLSILESQLPGLAIPEPAPESAPE